MKKLIYLLCFIISWVASAAGVANLKGTLRNFSDKTIEVEVNGWLYTVSKDGLRDSDFKKIKNLKAKAPVDFWVSFDAITNARKL